MQRLAVIVLAFVGLSLVPAGISHGQAAGQLVDQGRSLDSSASGVLEVVTCEPEPECPTTTTTTTTTTSTTTTTTTTTATTTATTTTATTTVPVSTSTLPASTSSLPGSTSTAPASSVAPSTAAPTTNSNVSPDLPTTGSETGWLALFAVALLALGVLSVAFARRAPADDLG